MVGRSPFQEFDACARDIITSFATHLGVLWSIYKFLSRYTETAMSTLLACFGTNGVYFKIVPQLGGSSYL